MNRAGYDSDVTAREIVGDGIWTHYLRDCYGNDGTQEKSRYGCRDETSIVHSNGSLIFMFPTT